MISEEGDPIISLTVHEYTKLVEHKESLDRNLTKITLERDYLNQEIQKIYNSKSWKLLLIPRTLKRLLKLSRKKINKI